jgi:hypothetical protein
MVTIFIMHKNVVQLLMMSSLHVKVKGSNPRNWNLVLYNN